MVTGNCYFDKRGFFHSCGEDDRDCIGCEYEKVIANSMSWFCQYCGEIQESRYMRQFCSLECKLNWQRARMEYVGGSEVFDYREGLFYGAPILDENQLCKAQELMLGRLWVTNHKNVKFGPRGRGVQ